MTRVALTLALALALALMLTGAACVRVPSAQVCVSVSEPAWPAVPRPTASASACVDLESTR